MLVTVFRMEVFLFVVARHDTDVLLLVRGHGVGRFLAGIGDLAGVAYRDE